jgi:hypothetical protein
MTTIPGKASLGRISDGQAVCARRLSHVGQSPCVALGLILAGELIAERFERLDPSQRLGVVSAPGGIVGPAQSSAHRVVMPRRAVRV